MILKVNYEYTSVVDIGNFSRVTFISYITHDETKHYQMFCRKHGKSEP